MAFYKEDVYLISYNLQGHFSKQVSRTAGPSVLLESECFEGTW